MGKHLIKLVCDYCGTRALVNPASMGRRSLACDACGAPARPRPAEFAITAPRHTKAEKSPPLKTVHWSAKGTKARKCRQHDDDDRKYRKRRNGFRPMKLFAKVLDEIEDLFD